MTEKLHVNAIFTHDDHPQTMTNLTMTAEDFDKHLGSEAKFVRWVLFQAFDIGHPTYLGQFDAVDLVKVSMCIRSENMDEGKLQGFKGVDQFMKRGGKYYFQPDRRDKVENSIIRKTFIAQNTKPFNEGEAS